MNPKTENPLTPPLALGGALLLLISLFLNWFSISAEVPGKDPSLGLARPDTAVLLFVIAIVIAVGVGAGRMRGDLRGKADLLAFAGGAAFLYALVSLIKKPQLPDLVSSAIDEAKSIGGSSLGGSNVDASVGIDIGLILALLGGLLLLAAGLMELLNLGSGTGGPGRTAGAGAGAGLPGGGATPPPPAAGTPTTAGTPTAAGGAAGGAAPPADRSPGWQPDPYGQARLRYWDGNTWTEHTGG